MLLKPIKIGNLELNSNLFLSPLAGYTNLPFRLVLRELGGLGMATTDLVNARSLIERNPKALKLIETSPEDHPLAVQLFGSVPEEMQKAAVIIEQLGVAEVIDINMGCPVRKVCATGSGAAMLKQIDQSARLITGILKAVKLPVTVKMRLGWDDNNITAPELAKALEEVGVSAIFVHGRTREQGFSGKVNLEGIRAVVEAVKSIPVIGNGDVTTPEAAKVMLERTGCAGVSIGRGAFYNPLIFKQTYEYLKTGLVPPDPSFEDRVSLMIRHFELMIKIFGEPQGCRMFRKIAPMYARGFGPSKEFIKNAVLISTREDFYRTLEHFKEWRKRFLDENGELKPQYKPSIPIASFLQEDALQKGADNVKDTFKVPHGPVEWW